MLRGTKHTEETKNRIRKAIKKMGIIPPSPKGKKHSLKSRKNMSKAQKGRIISEEHRKKISNKLKGRKLSSKTREKMSISKRNMSVETKRKMSNSRIGSKCNFWKGGITPENKLIRMGIDYRLWREAVFARDNWTCQITGTICGKLIAHHIQNFSKFPELRFAIDNGITLSKEAHDEFHKKYGKQNNTKEQLEEFFKQKQLIKERKLL